MKTFNVDIDMPRKLVCRSGLDLSASYEDMCRTSVTLLRSRHDPSFEAEKARSWSTQVFEIYPTAML